MGLDILYLAGCTARSYWSITRHGVRYAGSEDFEDFGVTLVEFQEQIVQNHLEGSGEAFGITQKQW